MSNLRIIGVLVGSFGLLMAFMIFRGPKWKRRNFLLLGFFSFSLIIVSINPDVMNAVAEILKLERRQRGRVLALFIISNIFLWFSLIYLKAKLDKLRYQFDLLIRSLWQDKQNHITESYLKGKDIVVVIPAFNEAENLGVLLPKIPKSLKGKKVGVLVVDDGSDDNSVSVVSEAGFMSVKNPINRGGGAALRLGYDILKRADVQICVTMDGDCQHQPEDIQKIVAPIIDGKYDLVIGSRVLGRAERDNFIRLFGVHIFGVIISFLLGQKITDPSSGFRAFKIRCLNDIRLFEDQYHTSELIINAVRRGQKIGEIPITIRKRMYGKSKKGKEWMYGIHFAKTIVGTWWRK